MKEPKERLDILMVNRGMGNREKKPKRLLCREMYL